MLLCELINMYKEFRVLGGNSHLSQNRKNYNLLHEVKEIFLPLTVVKVTLIVDINLLLCKERLILFCSCLQDI